MPGTTKTFKALTTADIHSLIVEPVQRLSVALDVSTITPTAATEMRFPRITSDPTAAFVAELDPIPQSDAGSDEIVARPVKVAGLSTISVELAEDSSPAAAQVVGDGIVRSIADRVDAAYFGPPLPAPAPSGLRALTGATEVEAPADWLDADPFYEAVAAGEQSGAAVSTFVAHPTDALALSVLKAGAGSNVPLLGSDPTAATRRVLAGVGLVTSKHVEPGVVWGIPRSHCFAVVRKDAEVETSEHFLWANHGISVRGVMRVAFALPYERGVVKIQRAAA